MLDAILAPALPCLQNEGRVRRVGQFAGWNCECSREIKAVVDPRVGDQPAAAVARVAIRGVERLHFQGIFGGDLQEPVAQRNGFRGVMAWPLRASVRAMLRHRVEHPVADRRRTRVSVHRPESADCAQKKSREQGGLTARKEFPEERRMKGKSSSLRILHWRFCSQPRLYIPAREEYAVCANPSRAGRPRGAYFEEAEHRSFPALAEREPCLSHNGPVIEPSAARISSIWIWGMVHSRLGVPVGSSARKFVLVATGEVSGYPSFNTKWVIATV